MKINQALQDNASSSSATTGAAVATSSPHHSHSNCLISLETSSNGEIFGNLFSVVMEGEHLSDGEKICHLQAAMKTEEVETVVRHASAKGNYDEVVAALCQRYDKTRVVYAHHVNSHTSRSPIKHNCDDFIRAQQELDLHYCGLNTHLGDTLGQFLTAATVQLMDAPSLHHSLGRLHLQQEGAARYGYPACLFGTSYWDSAIQSSSSEEAFTAYSSILTSTPG